MRANRINSFLSLFPLCCPAVRSPSIRSTAIENRRNRLGLISLQHLYILDQQHDHHHPHEAISRLKHVKGHPRCREA